MNAKQIINNTLYCSICNTYKSINCFHKRSSAKSGYQSSCKSCRKKSNGNYMAYYYQMNKSKIKANNANYAKIQRLHNSNYRIARNLRKRVHKVLHDVNKSVPTMELLGCTIEKLKTHLQQTAINNGYTDFDIENYSGKDYHIDHIKPCASFDLTDPEQQRKCFHYTNLQILTAHENLRKNKY